MNAIQNMKSWIGALTDLGLMLLALGIVCALLVGGANIPFFGNVAANITTFVKDLGSQGLVGLDRARLHPLAVRQSPDGVTRADASAICRDLKQANSGGERKLPT